MVLNLCVSATNIYVDEADDDYDDDEKQGLHPKWESKTWHLCVKAIGDCGWA